MLLTSNERRALKRRADAREGTTVPTLVRGGCTIEELQCLVRGGLASVARMPVPGKPSSRAVVRLRISPAGRTALSHQNRQPGRAKISVKLVLLVLFVVGVLDGMCVGVFMISPRG
jgi:hypothetical protein